MSDGKVVEALYKSKGSKTKRRRAKDFVSVDGVDPTHTSDMQWTEAWDPYYRLPYYFNTDTQVPWPAFIGMDNVHIFHSIDCRSAERNSSEAFTG